MTKIICMASAKGGSGKTTLTATFASFLATLGKKVLMIDTDAATNGLTLFYLKEVQLQNEVAIGNNRKPCGIYELASCDDSAEIITLKNGVFLIPSTYSFINTENIQPEVYKPPLEKTLMLARESYDYIFLDAQAGSDHFAHISMSKGISDEVIIVSEYDPMSAAGVERLKGLFREDLTYNRTWVLLNKMLPDFVQSFSDFLEVAKYLSPVPWDAEVVRSYSRRKLPLDLKYGNEYTLAIMQTLKSFLGENISDDLDSWANKQSSLIRQPIEDQYSDTKEELQILMQKKYRFKRQSELRRFISTLTLMPFVLLLIFGKFIEDYFSIVLTDVFVIGILFVSIIIFIKLFYNYKSDDAFFMEFEIIRNQKVLEGKLNRLEALREANLETLVRSNFK